MEEQNLNIFDFSDLKDDSHIIFYKDKFMMGDNIGEPVDWSRYGRYINLFPTKSQCTLFIFLSKGSMKIRINFKDYEMLSSDAVVILPSSLTQVLEISPDAEMILMCFADNTFYASIPANEMVDYFNQIQECPILSIPESQHELFLNIYKMLRADMADADMSCRNEALLGYMQICIAHARHWVFSYRKSNETTNHNRSTQIYMQFVDLVSEYHCQHRDVSFYAEKMCLSPKYMSQVVLSVSGKYPLDIIKDQVIFEAKALLKSHRHSVQEVAYLLNFPNPSFFGKYFRSEVGCSPRAYMYSEEA